MDREILDRAQSIMTNRRMKAVSENERRIKEINEKIPQIREINDAVFNTGKELIKLFSTGDKKDVEKKLEQLKNYNLGAQQMSKKILAENGYPENYLELQYECSSCHDTGYFGDRFCSCFNKLCGKLAADELNKTANLKLSSFDSFRLVYYQNEDYQIMKRILEFTQQYAATFQPHSESILMFGKTGLGNLVALPLQGMALKNGNSAFIDENWNAYENQWQILKNVKRISVSFINDKIKEWGADNVLGLLGDNTENETSSDVSRPWEKKLLAFDSSDVSGKMQIVLADKVYISTKNIKPRLQNLLRRMAAFSNPEFYKKSRMEFSVKGISRIIYCGSDEGGYICLPRSLIESVETKANEAGIEYFIDDSSIGGEYED